MKKEFEKIKERLEKETLGKPTPHEFDRGINRAIQIVSEVEAECKNDGWIPCSERMPERNETRIVWITVMLPQGKFTMKARWNGLSFEWPVNGKNIDTKVYKIVAWKQYYTPAPWEGEQG